MLRWGGRLDRRDGLKQAHGGKVHGIGRGGVTLVGVIRHIDECCLVWRKSGASPCNLARPRQNAYRDECESGMDRVRQDVRLASGEESQVGELQANELTGLSRT